jgi:hypothetical protein
MIRSVISTTGLAAEFALYQCQGYVAGYLAATAIVAAAFEIASVSPIRRLADRLIGAHLPESNSAAGQLNQETTDA